jgi:hypothetical protein
LFALSRKPSVDLGVNVVRLDLKDCEAAKVRLDREAFRVGRALAALEDRGVHRAHRASEVPKGFGDPRVYRALQEKLEQLVPKALAVSEAQLALKELRGYAALKESLESRARWDLKGRLAHEDQSVRSLVRFYKAAEGGVVKLELSGWIIQR